MKHIFVKDISLSAILASLGVPLRWNDPVTREVQTRDGKECRTVKFWFDVSDVANERTASDAIKTYDACGKEWSEYTKDPEDPIYWMKGALENRTMLLDLMHNGASEMKVIENGDQTIYLGHKLSERNKQTLKKLI